jgi:hypothetical protein
MSERTPRYTFGPRAMRVGRFLLERREAGDRAVDALEAVHEHFPGLAFYDFLGGYILADGIEAGTARVCSDQTSVIRCSEDPPSQTRRRTD